MKLILFKCCLEYEFSGPSGQTFNGKIARAQKYHPSYFNIINQGDLNSDEIIDILDVILAVDIVLNQSVNILHFIKTWI